MEGSINDDYMNRVFKVTLTGEDISTAILRYLTAEQGIELDCNADSANLERFVQRHDLTLFDIEITQRLKR